MYLTYVVGPSNSFAVSNMSGSREVTTMNNETDLVTKQQTPANKGNRILRTYIYIYI